MWNLNFMDLFQGCKGTRQNTTLRNCSAEGRGWGQAGGSQKSVTPSFPKFWSVFLKTFWQKNNRCFMVRKHHFLAFSPILSLNPWHIFHQKWGRREREGLASWSWPFAYPHFHIFFNLAKIIRGNIVNEQELSFGEAPFFLKETFSRLRSNLHHYSFWVLSKMYNIPWKNI